jgi:hypothetical protein
MMVALLPAVVACSAMFSTGWAVHSMKVRYPSASSVCIVSVKLTGRRRLSNQYRPSRWVPSSRPPVTVE